MNIAHPLPWGAIATAVVLMVLPAPVRAGLYQGTISAEVYSVDSQLASLAPLGKSVEFTYLFDPEAEDQLASKQFGLYDIVSMSLQVGSEIATLLDAPPNKHLGGIAVEYGVGRNRYAVFGNFPFSNLLTPTFAAVFYDRSPESYFDDGLPTSLSYSDFSRGEFTFIANDNVPGSPRFEARITSLTIVPVPEPGLFSLIVMGIVVLMGSRHAKHLGRCHNR